jgi:hypothetical protein
MRQVLGADIGNVDFGESNKVADLIFFDGPLLSLYRNNEGENFFHYWCEADNAVNRWLVFKVGDQEVEEYLKGHLTLKTIVTNPKDGFLYSLDIGADNSQKAAFIVSPKELPVPYLPSDDSLYEDEPLIEQREKRSTLKVAITGDWNFADLHYFPRIFREAYAFICEFSRDIVGLAALPKFPMRDGFSTVHLFRQILNELPSEVSPSLRGVKYASPGAIMFNVNREITMTLLATLDSVRSGASAAAVTYAFLHSVLADKKMLGVDVTEARVTKALSAQLGEQAVTLAREMNLPNPEAVLEKSANSLMAAKIMLAYYRLIRERVLAFERDERISIPTLP